MNYAECLNPFRRTLKAGIVGAPIDFRMPTIEQFDCSDVPAHESVAAGWEPIADVAIQVREFLKTMPEASLYAIRIGCGIGSRRAVSAVRYLEHRHLVEHSGKKRCFLYRVAK